MKRKLLMVGLLSFFMMGFVSCGSKTDNSVQDSGSSVVQCDIKFHVTYYMNDGTDKIYYENDEYVNTKATRPKNPTREGYLFRGWYIDQDCLVNFGTDSLIKADTKLYALWVDNPNSDVSTSETNSETTSDNISTGTSITDTSTSVDIPTGTTYTITDLPTWIQDDGCVIFAWVWGNTNPGEWLATKYTGDTTLTFTTNGEITGMLLARCVAGTETPNWDLHDPSNDPGRVYNQTEDIAIASGVTTYSCSSWKEYH